MEEVALTVFYFSTENMDKLKSCTVTWGQA